MHRDEYKLAKYQGLYGIRGDITFKQDQATGELVMYERGVRVQMYADGGLVPSPSPRLSLETNVPRHDALLRIDGKEIGRLTSLEIKTDQKLAPIRTGPTTVTGTLTCYFRAAETFRGLNDALADANRSLTALMILLGDRATVRASRKRRKAWRKQRSALKGSLRRARGRHERRMSSIPTF